MFNWGSTATIENVAVTDVDATSSNGSASALANIATDATSAQQVVR
jgi:hypothetical protein